MCTPVLGALSDRVGRRPIFLLGALVDVCGGEASILHLPNAIALWREELAKDFEADDSAFPTWVKGGDFADLTARLRKLASPELVPRCVQIKSSTRLQCAHMRMF